MFFFREQKVYTYSGPSCTHLQNAVNSLFLRIVCSDFQECFVCIQFVDFRGVLQNRICFSVYHSGQCHGMIAIVSLVDDKRNTRTLSIAVRYQNACHNIKIRCNNSSVLALSFLRLLAFSRDLARAEGAAPRATRWFIRVVGLVRISHRGRKGPLLGVGRD